MPYKAIEELPDPVREHLPTHGQVIYKEAFNSAWEQYQDPEKREEGRDVEETAHAVAWNAVKNVYHKVDDKWVEKNKPS